MFRFKANKLQVKLFKFFIYICIFSTSIFAEEIISIEFNDDEIQVQKYDAKGDDLLIIFPSDHGITDGLKSLTTKLVQKNIEVWIADPFSSWFLPTVESSLGKIPIEAYAQTIKAANKTNKDIYLLTNDKGAGLLLKAVHKWQSNSKEVLSGVILISPNLYQKTPSAGSEGVLLEIASATNIPVSIFVPEKSTLSLRINDTVKALKEGGSDVSVKVLKDVRDRFFFREDSISSERKLSLIFSSQVLKGMEQTRSHAKKRVAVKLNQENGKKNKKITRLLNKYNGDLKVKDFTLKDISGNSHTLSKYKGRVVLLNFWASWCPPCVHEMPSMSKLKDGLKDKPFDILAVNLGETPQQMSQFLQKHPVNFTILLDPLKNLAKEWKVFAFPTSYIIDKKGKIRYSVAGGFDWDTDEVKAIINQLESE